MLFFLRNLKYHPLKPIEYQNQHFLGKWKYSIKLIVIQKLKYFLYSYKCYKYNDYIFYCTYLLLLCENTKKYEYAYPGSNKVVYGAWEQESEEKNEKFYFWICKIRLSEKKIANAKKKLVFMYIIRSGSMSRFHNRKLFEIHRVTAKYVRF